jgi:hypothetical protein
MSRLSVLIRLCACLTMATAFPLLPSVQAGDKVEIRKGNSSTLDITINGQPFAIYNYGETLPKPYLLPVRTAAGVVINRELGDPSDADHPHHKGMWNAIDEVNGVKFWAEKGVIRNTEVVVHSTDAESASLQATNEWRNPETEKPEVIEKAMITFFPNRLIIYDMTFTAPGHDVVFEDTKEGLFGFRVAPSMKEKNGGRVVASDGSKTTANCWGKSFPWIDYSGEVNGKTVGVTIMDHPKNFRPSRYHVRDYGLFSISPFGEKAYTNGVSEAAPVHLKSGESLRLRYAMYFHDGDAEAAQPQKAYEQFIKVESP